MDWVFRRQRIAKLRPGWTLNYIDTLSEDDVIQVLAYEDGEKRWWKQNNKRRSGG